LVTHSLSVNEVNGEAIDSKYEIDIDDKGKVREFKVNCMRQREIRKEFPRFCEIMFGDNPLYAHKKAEWKDLLRRFDELILLMNEKADFSDDMIR
jgi:hypothetical protein